MYRVMLADDEKWSLFGLSRLVEWEKYGCEIVGMAYDGLSALEMCRREKPDLLISDIRMPGLDGLELARALAMELPEITVILMTGYSDLSYAQGALRLGVFDFLLKQISEEDMDAMLRRYLVHASAASADKEQVHKRSASFYFSFFDETNGRSVRRCLEDLCVQAPYSSVQVITLLYDGAVTIPTTQIYQADEGMALAFHTGPQRITCYCFSDGAMPSPGELCRAFGLPAAPWTGMSETENLDAGFYTLYQHSSLALLTAKFWQQPAHHFSPQVVETERMEPLRRALVEGNESLACSIFEQLLQGADRMQLDALEVLLGRATALLATFRIGEFAQSNDMDLYQYASAGGSAQELWADLQGRMETQSAADLSPQQQMQRILDYIDLHFADDLRLSDLAGKFFLNASYLSTLIRKRTGKTYSDIVTEKRIAYARGLLKTTDTSVMEIAHLSGYHEYSHFNALFKRMTGMTPAQYRAKA